MTSTTWADQVAAYPDLADKVTAGRRTLRGAAKEARRRESAAARERRREAARRVDEILDRPLTTTAAHFHVFAVQDFGGSQEYWVGEEARLDRAAAEQLARDMAEADTAYVGGVCSGMDLDAWKAAEQKFGDRLHDLISTNVNPGWEAIYVRPCQQEGDCDLWADHGSRYSDEFGDPWWTPSKGEHNPDLVPF